MNKMEFIVITKNKVNQNKEKLMMIKGFTAITKTMFKQLDKINIKKANFKNKEICNQDFIKQNLMF